MAKKDKNEEITPENTTEEIIEADVTADIIEPEVLATAEEQSVESQVLSAEELSTDAVSAPEQEILSEEVPIEDSEENDNEEINPDEPVTVQSVKFASFEEEIKPESEQNKNLDILMDIKLQLTVELGRTELPVKKVLELTRGSIVELEKVAGEPVELYANGKLVAQGEVVVIEDNFGLRITSITDPEDRLKGL